MSEYLTKTLCFHTQGMKIKTSIKSLSVCEKCGTFIFNEVKKIRIINI